MSGVRVFNGPFPELRYDPGPLLDRAVGAAQGAVDVVTGTEHSSRAWVAENPEREAGARARWSAGLPARNRFERDVYREHENRIAADSPRAEEVRARLGEHAREIEAHSRELEAEA
jgi:hypothetical protein